jgi:hypothetical protein
MKMHSRSFGYLSAALIAAALFLTPFGRAQNRIFDSVMAPLCLPRSWWLSDVELAELKPTDKLYDLGSGDGRMATAPNPMATAME